MAKAKKQPFNVSDFLSKMDGGRTLQTFRKNQKVFAQGPGERGLLYPGGKGQGVRHVAAGQGGCRRATRTG